MKKIKLFLLMCLMFFCASIKLQAQTPNVFVEALGATTITKNINETVRVYFVGDPATTVFTLNYSRNGAVIPRLFPVAGLTLDNIVQALWHTDITCDEAGTFLLHLNQLTDGTNTTLSVPDVTLIVNCPPIQASAIMTTYPTCLAPTAGELSLNLSGGSGNYNILLPGATTEVPVTSNPFPITGIAVGDYALTITDANCPTSAPFYFTYKVEAQGVSPLLVSAEITTYPTCLDPTAGEVTVSILGGSGNYEVLMPGATAPISVPTNPIQITGVAAGDYVLTVYDVDCPAVAPFYFTYKVEAQGVSPLLVSAEITTYPTCLDPTAGEVTVTILGGSGNYEVLMPGATAPVSVPTNPIQITGVAAGDYVLTVYDVDCPAVAPFYFTYKVEAQGVSPLLVSAEITTYPTCLDPTAGEVTVTILGGSGNYEVLMPGATTPVSVPTNPIQITGVAAGDYVLTVYDVDCPAVAPFYFTYKVEAEGVSPLLVSAEITTYPTCLDPTAGVVNVSILGGSGNYEVLMPGATAPVSVPANPISITGVAAGDYVLTVYDVDCPAVAPFYFSYKVELENIAPLQVSAIMQKYPTCLDPTAGEVTVTILGGSGNYEVLMPGATAPVSVPTNPIQITGVAAGDYVLTVYDVDCPAVAPFYFTYKVEAQGVSPLLVSAEITTYPTCLDPTAGEVTVTILGGSGNYEVLMPGATTPVSVPTNPIQITGVAAGDYVLTVYDVDCPAVAPFYFTYKVEAEGVSPLLVSAEITTYPTCLDPTAGVVNVSILGGSGNYEVLMPGATAPVSVPANPISITGVAAGDYVLTVYDVDCPAVAPFYFSYKVELENIAPLQVSAIMQKYPTCLDPTAGEVTVTILGGSGNYEVLMPGATAPVSVPTNPIQITGVAAGDYVLTVYDVDCPAVAPFYFTYKVEAQGVSPLLVSAEITTYPTCLDPTAGEVTVTILGGSGNYEVLMPGATAPVSVPTNPIQITGVAAGDYVLTVYDVDCPAVAPFYFTYKVEAEGVSPLLVSAEITAYPTCLDPTAGEVTVSILGGSGNYEVLMPGATAPVSVPANPITITGVAAGDYVLTVYDVDCPAVAPFYFTYKVEAENTTPILVNATVSTLPTCVNPLAGEIEVSISGGSNQTYTINYNNGTLAGSGTYQGLPAGTHHVSNIPAGNYTIIISDDSCAAVAPLVLNLTLSTEEVAPLAASLTITNTPKCEDPTAGAVAITATGGVVTNTGTDYLYTLYSNSVELTNNNDGIFTGLEAAAYKVVVTDPDCAAVAPVVVEFVLTTDEVDAIVATVVIDATPSCAAPTAGAITATATGGTPSTTYTYTLWYNGNNTANATGVFADLVAGAYKLLVTDDSCAAVAPAVVEFTLTDSTTLPLNVVVDKTNPTCPNNDGEIILTVTGGSVSPDYTYVWSNGGTTATAGDTLAAGTYTVTVYDAACPAVVPVVLNIVLDKDENTLLIVLDEKINPSCPDSATGKIFISVYGGNGDYTYTWATTNGNGLIVDAPDQSALTAGNYSVTVSASGDNNSCTATLDNIILTDPFNLTTANLSDYVGLIGQDLYYYNGETVPTINLLSNPLPEATIITFTTAGDDIGIVAAGGAEIPGFVAKNPVVEGESQVVVTVTLSALECAANTISDTFTITVGPKTIEDLDLVANSVLGQSVCFDEVFDDITFTAHRTDGATLADVAYIVDFVNGVDVLTNHELGEIPVADAGLWAISGIATTDRISGTGLYKVTPRSNNGEGVPAFFTLTVMPEPSVDTLTDITLCNHSELYVAFTSPNEGTLFDWTVDAAGSSLGIPASGSTVINVHEVVNNTNAVVTAVVTVTPRVASCPAAGSSRTFNINVLPTAVADPMTNVVLSHGQNSQDNAALVDQFTITGVATEYEWSFSNPAIFANGAQATSGVELADAAGEALIPAFDAQNIDQSILTSVVTVTPNYVYVDAAGVTFTCHGTPVTFTVIVASRPALDAMDDVELCEGQLSTAITPPGLPAGAGYYIHYEGGAIVGLADWTSDGKKIIPQFIATTPIPGDTVSALITVTPYLYYGGIEFEGDATTYTIRVYPKTVMGIYAEGNADVVFEHCEGDASINEILIDVIGYELTYQWYKNDVAIAGATDPVYNIDEVNLNSAATYYCIVGGHCDNLKSKNFVIKVMLPMIEQRYDDVMLFITNPDKNGGYDVTTMQWYTMDIATGTLTELLGANLSFYHAQGSVDGITYVVKFKTSDGKEYQSCPVTGVAQQVTGIKIYPNPVDIGTTLTVVAPLPQAELDNLYIQIVSVSGQILMTKKATGAETTLTVPNSKGNHILRLFVAGTGKSYEYVIIIK